MAAALMWGCSVGVSATPLEPANEQTRRFVQETMAREQIPGMQVAIIKNDRIVLSDSYGWANVENRTPATKTTLFPINSATKSFTGVAIAQLAEAGLVDVNAPVSRYLDSLPETWRTIRVRQLLAHTSGLPDILDEQGLIGGGSVADAWQAVMRRPMDAPVGERFIYNQTNYMLLAQIIARQTKMPYEQFVAKRQFASAHMTRATFGDSYDLIADAATMYSLSPRKTDAAGGARRLSHWFYDVPPELWSGAGIQTTADEVANWLIALSTGALVGDGSVQRMWIPEKLNNGTNGDWAAGWAVLKTTPERQVAGMGGARAAFIVYPEQRLAIVVLTNLVGSNPQRFIPQIAGFYQSSATDGQRTQ